MNLFKKHLSIILSVFMISTSLSVLTAIGLEKNDTDVKDWSQWNDVLDKNWAMYRHNFIQDDGRVIDHRIGISTSEGQSYAMLRAVWVRDKDWFDRSYAWANENLKRKDDNLYAWKWGQHHDGTWGMIDKTAASDADQDIAFALLLAHEIWKDEKYLTDAQALLSDIWEKETIDSPLGRVMLPGDWRIDSRFVQINPSYFSPYAYRLFADADKNHDWMQLVETSYTIVEKGIKLNPTKLPEDWLEYSLDDGSVRLYEKATDNRSDYGYEAIRVYWRFALDAEYLRGNGKDDERPRAILEASNFLPRFWKIRGDLPGAVSWDGIQRRDKIESAAVYGASLPAIYLQDNDVALQIIDREIVPNLKPGSRWNTVNDYYSQNWLWMGLALYAMQEKHVKFPKKLDPIEKMTWVLSFE